MIDRFSFKFGNLRHQVPEKFHQVPFVLFDGFRTEVLVDSDVDEKLIDGADEVHNYKLERG